MIIKIPIRMSLGRCTGLIWAFLVSAIKKGDKNSEAKENLSRAKVIGGNSVKVNLATTKLAPQIKWASIRAM